MTTLPKYLYALWCPICGILWQTYTTRRMARPKASAFNDECSTPAHKLRVVRYELSAERRK